MTTYTATDSKGEVYTRNSTSFSFAFCVVMTGGRYQTPAWASDRAKAEKVAAAQRNMIAKHCKRPGSVLDGCTVEILPAQVAS